MEARLKARIDRLTADRDDIRTTRNINRLDGGGPFHGRPSKLPEVRSAIRPRTDFQGADAAAGVPRTALIRESNGLYIVAASTELGAAREQDGTGVFTRALLDGLAGAADTVRDKGTINVKELLQYVGEAVARMTDGAQEPTVPQSQGGMPFPLTHVR